MPLSEEEDLVDVGELLFQELQFDLFHLGVLLEQVARVDELFIDHDAVQVRQFLLTYHSDTSVRITLLQRGLKHLYCVNYDLADQMVVHVYDFRGPLHLRSRTAHYVMHLPNCKCMLSVGVYSLGVGL